VTRRVFLLKRDHSALPDANNIELSNYASLALKYNNNAVSHNS
jgi:hypothetical protein